MNEPLTIWVGAIVTLAVFSYLVKENAFYRFFLHAALGTTVGMGIVMTIKQVLIPNWYQPIANAVTGDGPMTGLLWVLALVPGSLWYFQMSKKHFWVSTLVSGLFIGVAAGLAFKTWMLLIMPQIGASLKPLNPFDGGFTGEKLAEVVSNFVFIASLLTALLYFFFSFSTESKLMGKPMRFGRLMIMVCLGGMFGSTVMTRLSYLLERLRFLYQDWIGRQILSLFGG
ncbi:MAG: hypothetical protein JW889_12740 [Verrucomicrobia bacterium]|nr:hypothetical protein [Verrucomicrobiota bacterium]